jgi:hypothetical protein
MWENWYSGVLVRMNAGVLVLGWECWYLGVLVRMNVGVLVLGWEYWYSLPILGSHTVGAGMLGVEDEQCDNQHEVEGVEGGQRGEHYKG